MVGVISSWSRKVALWVPSRRARLGNPQSSTMTVRPVCGKASHAGLPAQRALFADECGRPGVPSPAKTGELWQSAGP